ALEADRDAGSSPARSEPSAPAASASAAPPSTADSAAFHPTTPPPKAIEAAHAAAAVLQTGRPAPPRPPCFPETHLRPCGPVPHDRQTAESSQSPPADPSHRCSTPA